MMPRRALAIVSLLLALFATRHQAHAGDGRQTWRTITTEHFLIHYYRLPDDPGEEEVAQRVAVIAEEAHRRLVPYLARGTTGRGLNKRTHIYITDQVDDYNGFAGVVPYPSIQIFANSPDDRAELNDYDDWLFDLVLHEYTHILHIGTIRSWCHKAVNAVFGLGFNTVFAINQAQPRWIIEGLAVLEETHRTSAGRLRNSIWDMYLRAQTLEGRLQRLDQFSNGPIQFPYGNSPYLYGSSLLDFMTTRYGESIIRRMSDDYSDRCIPGGLNRSIKRLTGRTWPQHYSDWKADLERRYRRQIDDAGPLTETTVLLGARQQILRPSYLGDGEIVVAMESDGHRRQRIVYVDSLGRVAPVTATEVDAAHGPWPTSDGKRIVYAGNAPYRTNYYFNDLKVWDRNTKKTRDLTEGVRAGNPSLSADGRFVVFEYIRNGSRGIAEIDLEALGERTATTADLRVLVPAAGLEHAYTPVYSPDGKTVAFSWWRTGARRDVWTIDRETRALRQVTSDRAMDMEPRWSPDGKSLFFVSDRTGIFNLYEHELGDGGATWQATNVQNGVFDPTISPDGQHVTFVGFRSDGYTLETAALDRASYRTAPPSYDRDAPKPPATNTPPLPSKTYQPWSTLLRFSFSPFTYVGGYGQVIGLGFSGSDVIGRHAWNLSLGFGTGRVDDIAFSGNYSYRRYWTEFNVGVGRSLSRRGGFVIDGTDRGYDEESVSAGISLGLPLVRKAVEAFSLYASYSFSFTRNLTKRPAPDPNELVPRYPEVGRYAGLALSLGYSNLRRYLYSVSAEEGRYFNVNLAVSHRALGAQFDVYTASWNYGEIIPIRWPHEKLRNHVLSLSYGGGISGGDVQRRGAFYLGGYPSQDILRSIFDFTRPGGANLRGFGYASVYGNQFHVWSAEYRFPIAWIERGYQTLPIYFRRVHAKIFADYGGAFNGPIAIDKLKAGVGAELLLELSYLYYFNAALQLGYARGVSGEGGGNHVYFLLNNPF